MARPATRTEQFTGFPDEAIQFLLDLQAEQSRTWFKAHQGDYDRLCRRPLELFVTELQQRLVDVYPEIGDVEPHIFRIQRDTRFAKDKAPYKTNLAAGLAIRAPAAGEDRHTTPGMHFSYGLDGEFVALGMWYMEPALLKRYRALLDDARRGKEIMAITDALVTKGWQLSAMEALKRVPAPYAQDHPRADLLKRKGLAASIQPEEGLTAGREYIDWAEARLREAAPMMHWLERFLSTEGSQFFSGEKQTSRGTPRAAAARRP
jgi:uncharacterized protein (TIGR02453 family)